MSQQTKTVLIVVGAIIAIVLAVFSAYRSFRQEQGEVLQTIDLIPGGKAGEMQRQQQGGQEAPPIPQTGTGASGP